MKQVAILVVSLFSFISFIYAQNPQWITYDTSNSKLPCNWITTLAIEEQGTIWIGTGRRHSYPVQYTGAGLVSLDGTDWVVYDTSNSEIPGNYITAIATEDNGTKWIGTRFGLAAFDGTNWLIYDSANSELPSNRVFSIAIDTSGVKWIGTQHGLATIDGNSWSVYTTSNSGLPGNWIGPIAIEDNNTKWLAGNVEVMHSGLGLTEFNDTNWTTYNTSNSQLPQDDLTVITIDESGTKWVGCGNYVYNSLVALNDTIWSIYMLPMYWIITSIAIEENVIKWIGIIAWELAPIGLITFDGVNWEIYNTTNSGLPSNHITSIAIDVNSTKWIGTSEGLAAYNEDGIPLNIIENFKTVKNVDVSPNPFTTSTTLSYTLDKPEDVQFTIYNVQAQIVYIMQENRDKGEQKVQWNAEGLPAGMYYFRIQVGDQVGGGKIIKISDI